MHYFYYNRVISSLKFKRKFKLYTIKVYRKVKYLFVKIIKKYSLPTNSNLGFKKKLPLQFKLFDYYLYLLYCLIWRKKVLKVFKVRSLLSFKLKPYLGMTITFKKRNTFWNIYNFKKNISFMSIGSSRHKKKSWWNYNVKFKITKKLISVGLNKMSGFILKYKGFHDHWRFILKAVSPKFKVYYIKIKLLQPHNGCKGIHKRNRRKEKKKKTFFLKGIKAWPKKSDVR